MKPWIYSPTTLFRMGIAGEHPLAFICWISDPCQSPEDIQIKKVVVMITYGSKVQEVDITEAIKDDFQSYNLWRREIFNDWLSKQLLDFSDSHCSL